MTDHSSKPKSPLTVFNDLRIPHPRMVETLKTLEHFTAKDSARNIVLLVGPTGVGKTALIDRAITTHINEQWDQILSDPSYIPAFAISAPAIGSKGFSWRLLYRNGMEELYEPLIDKKTSTPPSGGEWLQLRRPHARAMLSDLHMAFANALIERKTRFFVIDEAAHFLAGRYVAEHMDALKSLSDRSNTTIILAGSYNLLKSPTEN